MNRRDCRKQVDKTQEWAVPGIPDRFFVRGDVPLTKEEIRVLTLAKLRVTPESKLLDIGAGTGSISVECGLLAPEGMIYAVEKEAPAIELIQKNCERFGVKNIRIIQGEAPFCLERMAIPPLDGVVVGGSSGRLKEIVLKARELLRPGARLVINAILLETVCEGSAVLKEAGFSGVEMMAVSVARGRELAGRTALEPLNPVFIIWGQA